MIRKFVTVSMLMTLSFPAFSQNINVDGSINAGSAAQLTIVGRGNYVCSAEDSFKHLPKLGRGVSQREAEINAIAECAKTGQSGAFFCKVLDCGRDNANGADITAIYDIVRDQAAVNINFRGNVQYTCYAEGFGSRAYVAKAPTRIEAMALAKSICAEDEGIRSNSEPDGFFCNTQKRDCEQISGVSGRVNIGGIIGGLIGRKKKRN